jgi:hypothetical protein
VQPTGLHVIAHEYIHLQQSSLINDEHPTVLEQSVLEGAADFGGELIPGSVPYNFLAMTKGVKRKLKPHLSSTKIRPTSLAGSITARRKSRAILAIGWDTASSSLITSILPTSAGHFAKFWK